MSRSKLSKLYCLTLGLLGLTTTYSLSAQQHSKNVPCCGVIDSKSSSLSIRDELRSTQGLASSTAIPNDNILRVYRLAIPIDYDFLTRQFQGDVNKAKEHWDMLESNLNRIYQRDFGIAFELIRKEELIRRTPSEAIFRWQSSYRISEQGTEKLNQLIGAESYDLAIWLTDFGDNRGVAAINGGFGHKNKGSATAATTNLGTTAHEIAHLLGASHTGTEYTQSPSHYSEPGIGTSLMSYGFHDMPHEEMFFSLVTINQVRRNLANLGYYTDRERTNLVPSREGYTDYVNYPIGIRNVSPRAKAFSFEQAQKTYRITRGTALRFSLPAFDDSRDYTYAIHQSDRAYSLSSSKAVLTATTWSPSPVLHFMLPEYQIFRGDYTEASTRSMTGLPVGTYKLLIGAAENIGSNDPLSYKRSLDAVEATLEVVEGTPFRVTSPLQGRKLRAGEDITLTWELDRNLYPEHEKVRIWLSNDYGKSYKYLVVDEAPNSGSCTFKVPELSITADNGVHNKKQGRGVFLIEIKGQIACATSEYRPSSSMEQGGGFTIESSQNSLQPQPYSYLDRSGNPITPSKPVAPQTHKLTIAESQGGRISIDGVDLNAVPKGREVVITANPQSGYKFTSLKANGKDITATMRLVVNEDIRLEAVFTKVYAVTLKQNEAWGTLSIDQPSLNAIPENTTIRVTATPKEGYRLKSLRAGSEDILSSKSFVLRANTEVVAEFEKIIKYYTVTLNYNREHGEVTINQANPNAIAEGTTVSVTATPKEGYRLKSLRAGSEDILSAKSFVLRANTEVVAEFEKVIKYYAVTLNYNSIGGEVTINQPDRNAIAEGTTVSVTATPKEGYRLKSLRAGTEDILSAKSFVLRANTEVVAEFEKVIKYYAITLNYNREHGEVTINLPDRNAIAEGTTVSVTATPKEGYRLKSLRAGSEDILSSKSFVLRANTEVVAEFEKVPPTPPVLPTPPIIPEEEIKPKPIGQSDIKVYPTIFTSTLWVSGAEQIKRIVIYDLGGRKVQSWDKGESQLSVSELMSNIYVVVLYPKDGSHRLSFKVQKK